MLETVQKLSLQEAQENRAQTAREADFFLLPLKLELCQAMKKAGADYQAAVQSAGKGHPFGAPRCHVLLAA
eukprot:4276055-Lingulodinium_polyedra.AAC.1